MIPISTEQISATGTTGYAGTVPGQTHGVILSASNKTGRITFDGSVPGAATGHTIPLNVAPLYLPLGPGAQIKYVNATGTTGSTGAAVLDITYVE